MSTKSVDINNPMYRLPLELGWRREQVFKKMTRISDSVVYYYSPCNRKLRTLAEIKRLLDSSDYSPLTIKHFTFVKETITMNKIKEFDTDAVGIEQSTPRVEFFFKSKKEKTLPLQQSCDHELLENKKKKILNKIQINLNIDEKSISDQLETKDGPSITSKGISKDLDIFDIMSKVTSSTQTDGIEISEPKNKKRKINLHKETPTLPTNYEYIVMESMIHVFKHLKTHDLLTASRVCTSWNFVAMKSMFWQNVCLNYSMVNDWDKCIDTIEKKSSVSLDIRYMSIPIPFDEYLKFWSHFNTAIKRAKQLKVIKLCKCPPSVIENILSSLPQLEILNVTSIRSSNLIQETQDISFLNLNLNHLDQMENLTVLKLHGFSGIQFTIPSFINLRNLKTLSLTSVKKFPINIYSFLETVTLDLETLEIGDCELLSEKFAISLRRFINLRYLRLENGFNNFAPEVFGVIKSFNKLKILELINIKVNELVKDELKNCNCINSLLIIPDYKNQVSVTNTYIVECLINLSKSLTHVIWGITVELLKLIETFISDYENILWKGENESGPIDSYSKVPILNKLHLMTQLSEELPETTETDGRDDSISIDLVPLVKLETMLEEKLMNVKTKIIKVPFLETTEVYLAKYFNDI